MPANTDGPAYFTILSTNYLPKALTLADSLQRHHPGSELVVVVIDALRDDQLPQIPPQDGVRLVSTTVTGLPEAKVLQLAAIYDLVEFATATKPLVFRRLLERSRQAVYLDPDTYLTSPMEELPDALTSTSGGILLTPHFLQPVTEDAQLTEGHLLTVGVYNLGFGAVDRRARDFLDWWWGHLEWECLWDPLSGLFVDQKWVDIGSVMFHAGAWQHYGYNVSVANLHERPVVRGPEGYQIDSTGHPLRLFHFHAFDTSRPEELSTRFDSSTAQFRIDSDTVDALCREYADQLLRHEKELPEAPPYPYLTDTRGKRISRQLRRAYRVQLQAGLELPSPFVPADADAFAEWRRSAWRAEGKELLGDAAKSIRVALPEEYGRLKDRLPGVAEKVRSRFVRKSGIWG